MRDATLSEMTCIEELVAKLVNSELVDKEVFKQLWISYAKIFETRLSNSANLSTE